MSYVWTDANLNVLAYPYSRELFQRDHLCVSLPETPTLAQWAEYGVYPVRVLPKENYDSKTQYCRLNEVPQFIDGDWVIGWTVSNMTEAELDAALFNWRQSATCSPFQGRMALSDAGLLSQVEAMITGADEKTKVAWEYALEWRRTSPMIETLMTSLNISDAEADALFEAALIIHA